MFLIYQGPCLRRASRAYTDRGDQTIHASRNAPVASSGARISFAKPTFVRDGVRPFGLTCRTSAYVPWRKTWRPALQAFRLPDRAAHFLHALGRGRPIIAQWGFFGRQTDTIG